MQLAACTGALQLVHWCATAGALVRYSWCTGALQLVHWCATAGALVRYSWCTGALLYAGNDTVSQAAAAGTSKFSSWLLSAGRP
jgi:hypothetical protein